MLNKQYLWRQDVFDSEALGFKVAKIIEIESEGSPRALDEKIKKLKKELASKKVTYASFRVSSDNFQIIHALERGGFILVDGLITLNIDIFSTPLLKRDKIPNVREASESDIKKLREMTRGLFSVSRVFNDPFIPKNNADNFYIKWIENSIKGKVADSVLVWEEKERILGYITLQKKGQIPLVAVSSEARGKGVGKGLTNAALVKFKKWMLSTATIETQMSNIPALRLYESCGFKITASHLTFRWVNEAPRAKSPRSANWRNASFRPSSMD